MFTRCAVLATAFALLAAAETTYQKPPQAILDVLDAPGHTFVERQSGKDPRPA